MKFIRKLENYKTRESSEVRKNKDKGTTNARERKNHSLDVLVDWILSFG